MSCCQPQPPTCKPLLSTSIAKNIVVTDRRHCIRTIEPPTNPSLVLYDANNQVVWADGSVTYPICLPALAESDAPVVALIGLTSDGCLRKIPVTYQDIVTCEGPTLTVPSFDVVE